MTSQEIRQAFLDFFKSKDHHIVPSAPIVSKDDPTLMFNNSGMAQFKAYFLGHKTPTHKRIADTQKCLRVSGKHNDLDDVGFDTYHHTMFEMLGNWSFGDYFKKEAIAWAWEFLTHVLKLDKDRLYVSVFEGDTTDNVPFDQEAYNIWLQYISEDRIIKGNKKDNFWEMGDQGPCGPCSEIHIDLRSDAQRAKTPGKELVNADHPQVVEIWNNVFMEFNRKANGSLEKLSAQHVDTGMGFERLCMAMQNKTSNYDTDVFTPLIQKLESLANHQYTSNEIKDISAQQNQINIAIRVVVDHVRAVAFAIADGQLPSNSGAGYVIRRILRRAIRYGFTFLNLKKPFIFELVDVLANQMGPFFPEIKLQQQLVTQVIKEEEQAFLKTLDQGLNLLEKVMSETNHHQVSGQKVFELYDTYGFPKDLTALILKEKGYSFNETDFEAELQKQKNRSRAASEISTNDWVELVSEAQPTFVGYDVTEQVTKIVKYRKVESKKEGVLYQIVLDATPFYPEGGGQVGDQGTLETVQKISHQTIDVLDTKKENNLIIHVCKHLPSQLTETFLAKVNTDLRNKTAKNHSATHLMHYALRKILGTHVEQKGSLVAPTYLRFDFSHFAKVNEADLNQIENLVNSLINQQIALVEHRNLPFEKAIAQGAMALFGEKYGQTVRMIEFWESKELCGGIHVKNTADIWHFKIVSESAVAAGVRRIEAITGESVKDYYQAQEALINNLKISLKHPQDVLKSVVYLQEEHSKLKKQLEQLTTDKINQTKKTLTNQFKQKNNINYLVQQVDLTFKAAKDLTLALGSNNLNSFVFLAAIEDNLPNIHCYISKELISSKNLDANKLVKNMAQLLDGNGGGQPFFASGKGKNSQALTKVLNEVQMYLEETL